MAADVPTFEPVEFNAGDTLAFDKSLPDFASASYTLTYYLVPSSGTGYSIVASAASGNVDFNIRVTAAVTATYSPGSYKLTGYISDATSRYKIYDGDCEVLPNTGSDTGYDFRSWAEKRLVDVEATIASLLVRLESEYSINGRHQVNRSLRELQEQRHSLLAEIANAKSKGRNRKILGRFVRAR